MRKFKFTTHMSAAKAQLRSVDLVEIVKSPVLSTGVEVQIDLDQVMPAEIDDPYPVIILINGSAACGKGTLIKQIRRYSDKPVYELSTVDPCRIAAEDLLKYQFDAIQDLYEDKAPTAAEIKGSKEGPYRQLLSDIKKAWTGYDEGPNTYVVGTVIKLITDPYTSITESTGLPVSYRDGSLMTQDMPSMIFINAREPKDLDKLKHTFWKIGLICFTMYIDGQDIPESGGADCDYEVHNYEYDMTIKNKGSIDDLSVVAFTLSTLITRANRMCGVSIKQSKIDPDEEIGELGLDAIHNRLNTMANAPAGYREANVYGITSFDYLLLIDQVEAIRKNPDKIDEMTIQKIFATQMQVVGVHPVNSEEIGPNLVWDDPSTHEHPEVDDKHITLLAKQFVRRVAYGHDGMDRNDAPTNTEAAEEDTTLDSFR